MEELVSMQFDKEDVAAIAIAEAEKKMRRTIKDIKVKLSEIGKNMNEAEAMFKALGEEAIAQKTNAKMKIISAGIKATKIKDLETTLHKTINFSNHSANRYEIAIEMPGPHAHITVEKESIEITGQQKVQLKKHEKLSEIKKELVADSINWRKKLADMPMLERQVKATLARRQVETTKEGKAMVAAMIANFDQTIELLGE